MKLDDITHQPKHLWMASESRLGSAWTLLDSGDFAGAVYLGGLSVECVMQAIAIQTGKETDARHDLNLWLKKCPERFIDAVKRNETSTHWNRLVAVWNNRIRYLAWEGLLGYVRSNPLWNALKGEDEPRMKQFVKRFVQSAQEIQKIGVSEWQRLSKS